MHSLGRTTPAMHTSLPPPSVSVAAHSSTAASSFPLALPHYSLPSFDLQQPHSTWNPNVTSPDGFPHFMASSNMHMDVDDRPWLGYYGDEYSRYLQQTYFPSPQQTQSLNLQQHGELMETLEKSTLPDISYFLNDSATTYPSQRS